MRPRFGRGHSGTFDALHALHAKSQERPPAMHLAPVLTPHGLLVLDKAAPQAIDASALSPQQSARLERAFARGSGHGLLCLGADEVGTALPAPLSYWRELGARYVSAVCALPEMSEGLGQAAGCSSRTG